LPFADYWGDLVSSVPRIPPSHAQQLVNRSWADIRDFRLWSWLVPTGYITTPLAITAGVASPTLGSSSVTVDATADAALNAVVSANPPLFHAQVGIGRQFRVGNVVSGTPGPLYNITGYNHSTRTLTLDRPYAEVSASNVSYMVYKAYYQAPPSDGSSAPDFLRYFTITNPMGGYTIRRRKLYYTQDQLNSIDAPRGATGDAYIISAYLDDPASGNVVHEWYPHPVNLRVYTCIYQKRGTDLSDTIDVPKTFPSDLLMERAYMYGTKWALKNVAVFPELQQTNWVAAYQMHKQDFKERLIQVIKQDDEISPLVAFQQGGIFDFPLGGAFLQGHDISRLVGGLD
jgi:hypothetical protein